MLSDSQTHWVNEFEGLNGSCYLVGVLIPPIVYKKYENRCDTFMGRNTDKGLQVPTSTFSRLEPWKLVTS